MRYFMMIRGAEDAGVPPQALFDEMGGMIERHMKAGILADTGGLRPTAEGKRIRSSKGRVAVVDGPFTETKEVVGGFAIYKLASRDEATNVAKEFVDLHARIWPEWECTCELREIEEAG